MRLDMAVDGERNRVVEVDTVALPVGADNPYGNAFTIRETVLASELEAQRNVDFNAARFWKIESAEARNCARPADRLQAAAVKSGADLLQSRNQR